MVDVPDDTRLADNDPWFTVSQARQERGQLAAGWLTGAVAALRTRALWRAGWGVIRRRSDRTAAAALGRAPGLPPTSQA